MSTFEALTTLHVHLALPPSWILKCFGWRISTRRGTEKWSDIFY